MFLNTIVVHYIHKESIAKTEMTTLQCMTGGGKVGRRRGGGHGWARETYRTFSNVPSDI